MNLLSALALQLIGFTSVTLAQYPIKDEPAKGSTYDYCQANVINPEKYTPLFPDGELLSVQIFHRHGDRTPTVFIPPKFQVKDTWNCAAEVRTPTFKPLGQNRTLHGMYINQCEEGAIHCSYNPVAKRSLWKGNCYDGQLTPKGMDQLAETGKKFREIYVNKLKFLPENWSDANKQLYVRSTNVQRTEQSVASILNGWFPLKEGERDAKPIHYEVIPTQFDMLSPNSQCTKLKNLNAEFKKTVEYAIFMNKTKELRNYFNSFIKQDLNADMWTTHWEDALVSRSCHGMKPICVEEKNNTTRCMTEASLKSMQQAGNDEYSLWFSKNSLRKEGFSRVQIGPMLWEIKNNLINAPTTLLKDNQKPYARLKIYSAHDSTLGAILGSLDAKEAEWPPYAATITFELWNPKKNQVNCDRLDLSLRIIYNGQPITTHWCPNGVCKVRDYLLFIRDELGLVDPSIANLGTDPKAKTWDYFEECFENLQ